MRLLENYRRNSQWNEKNWVHILKTLFNRIEHNCEPSNLSNSFDIQRNWHTILSISREFRFRHTLNSLKFFSVCTIQFVQTAPSDLSWERKPELGSSFWYSACHAVELQFWRRVGKGKLNNITILKYIEDILRIIFEIEIEIEIFIFISHPPIINQRNIVITYH